MSELTFAEPCSGIGGFRLGLERAGWRCVWANDWDKYANKVYKKKFGNQELVEGDIREVEADSVPDHTLLTAGFPCQAFSVAGKRKGFKEARGTLFTHIARIVAHKRPPLLLLENVKGLLSSDSGRTFAVILRTLGNLGYLLEWQVLNSKHFGVPQNRERVFIVGHLRGKRSKQIFPIGEDNKEAICKPNRKNETGQETAWALRGRDYKDGTNFLIQAGTIGKDSQASRVYSPKGQAPTLSSGNRANSTGQAYSPKILIHNVYGGFKEKEPRIFTEESQTIRTPKGGGHLPLVVQPCLTPDRTNKRQHGRRFKENGEPMFTLTQQDIHGVAIANAVDRDGYLRFGQRPRDKEGKPQLLPIGYRRIRRLTPIECERLQGFPDGWTEGVSDTQRYKLLGNAVTVNVIEFLGHKLKECLN